MGDQRTYENTIALRIVESQDGMTADWVRLPYELLARISNRIINEVKGVNRVCLRHLEQTAEHDRVGVKNQHRYGNAVPDFDLTVEMSELLIDASTLTSSRKLDASTG